MAKKKSPENQHKLYVYKSDKGVSENIIREISEIKNEPEWMLKLRLEGLKHF